jgi:hypothetical protein
MPVPRVGFSASKTGICGAKTAFAENIRTLMALQNVRVILFGALMIGSTITG